MNNYMIPANSKKSQLILGFFTKLDLVLFISGASTTLISFMVFTSPGFSTMILMLMPILITGLLVMPVPHYHNVLQLIMNTIFFLVNRRKYIWRGWCIQDEN